MTPLRTMLNTAAMLFHHHLHGIFISCFLKETPIYELHFRPDFDASREKLRKLGDAEGQLTKEEFNKMKQELEAEYLATFKKTVAMHETFLCRLVSHPVFRSDMNLAIFLEYDKELNVRGKNKKEKLLEVLTSVQKSGDELLLSNTLKDVDEFFDNERKFLLEYFTNLRDATHKADKMVVLHKSLAENYIKISTGLVDLSAMDETNRGNEQVSSHSEILRFLYVHTCKFYMKTIFPG